MKNHLSLILSFFLAVACSLASEPPDPNSYPWKMPRYRNVEFYAVRLSTGEELMVARFDPKFLWLKPPPVCLGPFMSFDPQFPATEFDPIGGDVRGDHYQVSMVEFSVGYNLVKHPLKQITYSGTPLEVWKSQEFLVGMRPSTAAR